AEVIAAEGLSAAPAPVDDRMPPEPEPVETPPDLGWSRVDVPIPEDVEKLLQLGPGGDPFTVDERLRTARRVMQRIDWQLAVLPVATADDAWVARAGEVTLRRLVAEVEWALDRRDAGLPPAPPSPDATLAPVEWQMRARADEALDADITFTAAPSVVALFR